MFHKTFDNNLVAIPQSKVALKLNKHEYIGMWLFELSKAIMDELHHDYIKNKYDNKSKLLFMGTNSLMYEIKTKDVYKDVYKDFNSDKEMFNFSNYSTKSKYYDNSNKLKSWKKNLKKKNRNPVKSDRTRKVRYLLLHVF